MKKLFFIFILFLGVFFISLSGFFLPSKTRAQQQCVAIAGDSVDYGDVIYEDPSIGSFPVRNTGHLSDLVNGGVNYAVPAASLTVNNIYNDQQAVNSGCSSFVVGPWVNDLGQGDPISTANAIGKLIKDILSKNPNAKIFLVNYYFPQPASWTSNIWPLGFSQSRVNSFNTAIQSAFGSSSNVTIINVSGFSTSDIATSINGKTADGVHLSVSGKQKLASLINAQLSTSSSSQNSSGGQTNSSSSSNSSVSSGPAVNGNNVGPELAYPQAGQNVVVKNGFTGVVAVINNINNNDTPHNTAAGAHVVLRVDLNAQASDDQVRNYANQLAGSNAFANSDGKPTIVVLGLELNNLDQQGWNTPGGSLTQAADDYAKKFNIFSSILHLQARGKYNVAPAAPDLYNAVYNPATWVKEFGFQVNCGLVDGLVADVFDVTPAASVGGGNLDTWKYLQSHVCGGGKPMLHFEGWGADPHAPIKDQVDFLKNKPLVGAPTATSLIVNNCGSFGGNQTGTVDPNKKWLFWIPTTPDKVYNADGSEFDYVNCKKVAPNPFPVEKEVPCVGNNSTTDPEFHSLRPYPASPCYKKIDETALMCSNDLIVKKTFHVTRDQAQSCNGDVCNFNFNGIKNTVRIDLTNANLPIVGNTEDVPNGTWTGPNTDANNLSAPDRVNNYVSWYLNGVVNRAEEDFPIIDPNYTFNLVNFSGPINKLLPFDLGNLTRINSISIAQQTTTGTFNDKLARHNELVGCIADAGKYNVLSPCYLVNAGVNWFEKILFPQLSDRKRLAELNAHTPPLENDPQYKSFSDFWKTYLEWEGSTCSPTLPFSQFYLCVVDDFKNITTGNVWSRVFANVPMSSTEDRVGSVIVDESKTEQLKDGQGNGGTVSNVSFTPVSDNHNLYFSHVQEDAELAKLLQGTYATKSDSTNDWESQLQSAVASQDSPDTYQAQGKTFGCVPEEVLSNPGDNLYGNIDRVKSDGSKDQQITGTLSYNASFSCNFKPQTNQSCVNQCNQIPSSDGRDSCLKSCTSYTCDKDIYTSLSVFTKTPKAYELSQRLVDGAMGVFKRFFPKVGSDAPLSQIKDIPAETKVSYIAPDAEAKAGKTGNDGSNASLYFPHIGSLEEYFLKGIQKALRPQGMDSGDLIGQNQSVSLSPSGQCTNLDYSIDYLNNKVVPQSLDQIINNLTTVNPGGFTQSTIQNIKTSMNTIDNTTGKTRYQTIIDESIKSGYNPSFVMAIWIEETAAGTLGGAQFGCGAANQHDFDGQLSCFLGLKDYWSKNSDFSCRQITNGSLDFKNFMFFFSEGTCTTMATQNGSFCTNKAFPARVIKFYNIVKQ